MSIAPAGALRILHRAFSHYPPRHRAHILIRFFTAPFLRSLDCVPRGGRVLDIGGGHGTYAILAVHAGAREVVVVEPDTRKSLLPLRQPGVTVVAGYDDCVRGEFDAIVLYDAMHRIPVAERAALFRRIHERLAPGGTFILKDLDPEHRLKQTWARFQDWFADTFLRISIGEGFIFQPRAEIEAMLREAGFVDFRARDIGRGYPHPHILYTARKPA